MSRNPISFFHFNILKPFHSESPHFIKQFCTITCIYYPQNPLKKHEVVYFRFLLIHFIILARNMWWIAESQIWRLRSRNNFRSLIHFKRYIYIYNTHMFIHIGSLYFEPTFHYFKFEITAPMNHS